MKRIDPACGLVMRWGHGSQTLNPAWAGRFDPGRYTVDVVEHAVAKNYVLTHHYSGTWPSATLCYGLHDDRQQLIAKFKEILGLDVAPAELVPNPQIVKSGSIEAWAVIVDGLSLGLVLAHSEGFYVQASPGYKKLVLRPRYIDPVDGRFVYMSGDGVHNLAELGTLLSRERISMNSPPRLSKTIIGSPKYVPQVGVIDGDGKLVP